eukprot:5522207-Pyramimonas_sp.AAC.1
MNWVNGLWKCRCAVYDSRLSVAHRAIALLVEAPEALPRHCSACTANSTQRQTNLRTDIIS